MGFGMNSRNATLAILAACFVICLTVPVSAQYFGRNKVQFKRLDFQILKTEHFDIYYYPSAREGIDIAARMSERGGRLSGMSERSLRAPA